MLDEVNWNWWKITWNLYVRRDTDIYKNIKCCMFSVCCQRTFSFFGFVLPLFSYYSSGLCRHVWTWRNGPLAKMSCCQKRCQIWERKWCRERVKRNNNSRFYSPLLSETTGVPWFLVSPCLHVLDASPTCPLQLQHKRWFKLLCRLVTAATTAVWVAWSWIHSRINDWLPVMTGTSGCLVANSVK